MRKHVQCYIFAVKNITIEHKKKEKKKKEKRKTDASKFNSVRPSFIWLWSVYLQIFNSLVFFFRRYWVGRESYLIPNFAPLCFPVLIKNIATHSLKECNTICGA